MNSDRVLLLASSGLLALTGCSSSSSGGGSGSRSITFVDGGSTITEGATSSVQLRLNTSANLTAPATVTVSDAGSGTAALGDYTAFAPQVVTFPSGSSNGTILTVDLVSTADLSIEGGDETVGLELSLPTGAQLGGKSLHFVTIEDADLATIAFTTPSSTTPNEGVGTISLNAQLGLWGATLDLPVTVQVGLNSGGTATPGVDFTILSGTSITFPAGSVHGAMQTVEVSVVDDTDLESTETVMIELSSPSAGLVIGVNAVHSISITDDDVSTAAFVDVTSDDNPTSSGQTVQLGTQTVDAGPNAGVTLDINNLGTTAMEVSTLNLTGDVTDFSLETNLLPSATPPVPEPAVFPLAALVEERPLEGCVLEMDAASIAVLGTSEALHMQSVPMPGGGELELVLERLRSPWAPDAILAIDGVEHAVDEVLGDFSAWRGSAVGFPDSEAFLSFSSLGSRGWIRLGPEQGLLHLISENPEPGGGAPPARLVWDQQVIAASESLPQVCETTLYPPQETPSAGTTPPLAGLSVGFTTPDCRLAIETDFQYFQLFASSGAATTYATQLVAALSDRYEQDVQTTLSIAYLGLHTNSNDGWDAPDSPTAGTVDLINEFRAAWAPSSWPASADLAHFLSGAELGGGVAYVNVLCSQSFGFGVSANLDGFIDWGSFDGSPSPLNWDFVVTSHEIGHNFGSLHTHEYCPPLDVCYSNCNGSTVCSLGTIMSYCHTCGGLGSIQPSFHAHTSAAMRANVMSSCLGDSTLAGMGTASFSLRFEPTSSPGAKSVTLSFTHDAGNAPSPYQLTVTGNAIP